MNLINATIRRLTMKRVLVGLIAVPALVVGASAMPAAALSIDGVSNQDQIDWDGEDVEVEFTLDEGTTYYAVAVCNVDYAIGTACDVANAVGLVPVTTLSDSVVLHADGGFANGSFTGSGPGGNTSCKDVGGANCAIAVSQYTGTLPAVTHSASTTISVVFV